MGPDITNGGHRYTHGHAQATLASHGARTATNSAAYVLPHLRAGMDLLDVGCGPGPRPRAEEMVRVCRPDGWVAARDADYAAMAWHPEVPELEEWRRP